MRSTRAAIGAGLIGMLPLVFGCAWEVQAPKDPLTFIYHLGSEPDTLNRLTATDAYEGRINGFIFDNLIERDNQTLEFRPKMAKSWEVSEDKLTYTVYLRDDIKWHDGMPFTADDVVYTFDRIIDDKVNAGHLKNYYKDIKNVEKIDNYTVRFNFAVPYFKALEFVGGIPVVPKHVFEKALPPPLSEIQWLVKLLRFQDFNSHPSGRAPIGTGPYIFKEWQTGKRLVLERNPKYWDDSKPPHFKRILFKIISDDTVALQSLKKGELDLAGLRPIQWVRQTTEKAFNEHFEKHQYYAPGYRYVGWNQLREKAPFFKDKKVRQALARLINRDAVVNKLEYGFGKLTTGPFWPLGYEYNQSLAPIPFDPAGAKKLLDEAGWTDHDGDGIRDKDGVKFQFTFLIPSGAAFYTRLATIMKKDFENAGIAMDIQNMEWAAFVNRLQAKDFDAVSLGWTGTVDEDPYQIWHSSQIEKGSNHIGFKNEEADRIMEMARMEFDKEARTKLYHRLHEIIYDEQPYTFLYNGSQLLVRDKRFQNVVVYPLGVDFLEWKVSKDG